MSKDGVELQRELLKIKKDLEKSIIRGNIAPQSVQTSLIKKELVKSMGQSRIERLKNTSANYIANFQSSAKGEWVKKVQTSFESTSQKMSSLI